MREDSGNEVVSFCTLEWTDSSTTISEGMFRPQMDLKSGREACHKSTTVNKFVGKSKYNSILTTTPQVTHCPSPTLKLCLLTFPTRHHSPAHDEPTLAPTTPNRIQDRREQGRAPKEEKFFHQHKAGGPQEKDPKGKNRELLRIRLNIIFAKKELSSGAPSIIAPPTFLVRP